MAYKKKLYKFRPKDRQQQIETHFTKENKKTISVNSMAVERDVRQMLADKISGTLVGLWLLLPEHLRLGTWDLLTAWAGSSNANAIDPRLALQMVHESALCLNGLIAIRFDISSIPPSDNIQEATLHLTLNSGVSPLAVVRAATCSPAT